MNASEFRIGNIVEESIIVDGKVVPSDKPMKIGQIGFFGVHLYDINRPFSNQVVPDGTPLRNIQHVVLTEEWMLKFGFFRRNNAWVLEEPNPMNFGKSEFNVWNIEGSGMFNLNSAHWNTKITYVHQLQNLYFALTGRELTLKQHS